MSIHNDASPPDVARGIERSPTVSAADVVIRQNYPAHGRTELEIRTDCRGVPMEVLNALYAAGWAVVTCQRDQGMDGSRIRAARREEVNGL